MSVTDINALRKWKRIPKDMQLKLIHNVFCSTCKVTTMIDYTFHDDDHGVLLKGTCKTCGKNVARLVEDA